MLKTFSMLVVVAAMTLTGASSARAASGGCPMGTTAAPAPATARAPAPRAPAAAARPRTQTIRRYSAAPGAYRAPSMRSYRSNGSSGPSYSATRKILGY
ncbi:MAG TPA: hypothetical protein VNH11_24995 [Pirellulales bacterium]|nr:hypothetical protein [Pirellulales bacterium]